MVRAQARMSLRNFKDAEEDWTTVLKLKAPNDPERYKTLAHRAGARMRQGKNKLAEEDLTEALRLNPPTWWKVICLVDLADAQIKQGEYVQAKESATSAHRLNPNAPAALRLRASANNRLGLLGEAEEDWKMAARMTPDHNLRTKIPTLVNLAGVQLGLGKFKEAEQSARQALRLDPDSGPAQSRLTEALRGQDQQKQKPGTGYGGDPLPPGQGAGPSAPLRTGLEERRFPEPVDIEEHPFWGGKGVQVELISYLNRYREDWKWFQVNALEDIVECARAKTGQQGGKKVIEVLVLGASTAEEMVRAFHELVTYLEKQGEIVATTPTDSTGWRIQVKGLERNSKVLAEGRKRLTGESPFAMHLGAGVTYAKEIVETLNRFSTVAPRPEDFVEGDYTNIAFLRSFSDSDLVIANHTLQYNPWKQESAVLNELDTWQDAWLVLGDQGLNLPEKDRLHDVVEAIIDAEKKKIEVSRIYFGWPKSRPRTDQGKLLPAGQGAGPSAPLRTGLEEPSKISIEESQRFLQEFYLLCARNVNSGVRQAAATTLGHQKGKRALDALLQLARDPEEVVRHAAATALGHQKGKRALDALLRLARGPEEVVRQAAATALGHQKGKRALDALLRLAQDLSLIHI